MDSKVTFTKGARRRHASGFALVDAVTSIGLTGIIMVVLVSVTLFSGRSFVCLANYVELDDKNRLAIDNLTRDLRECNKVTYCVTNLLALEASDGFAVYYIHSGSEKTLIRWKAGQQKVLLTGCENLNFRFCKRNTITNTYEQFPAATPQEAKVVDVAWKCSRSILGVTANTEAVQTAKIVIRKQGS